MLIDTHVHLNMEPLVSHWPEVVKQANWAGVKTMIVPGASLESSRRGVEIAEAAEGVWAAVGIHPEEVDRWTGGQVVGWTGGKVVGELERLAKSKKVVGIGEIGLDYHYRQDNKDQQKELFKLQFGLAKKLDLPVIIHTREAEAIKDAAEILGNYSRCVYHCFSGDTDPGTYVGIGGTITFKGNDKLRQVVKQIPLDRILLETDAPWLAPEPVRGQVNQPAHVTITAALLAELKQVPLSQIIEQTSQNARALFFKENR